jgi:hypothetical protein
MFIYMLCICTCIIIDEYCLYLLLSDVTIQYLSLIIEIMGPSECVPLVVKSRELTLQKNGS